MLSVAAAERKAFRVKHPKTAATKRLKSPMVSVSPLGPAKSTGIPDCAGQRDRSMAHLPGYPIVLRFQLPGDASEKTRI
ncbi:unnamed protein product [Urochloa humidicola]